MQLPMSKTRNIIAGAFLVFAFCFSAAVPVQAQNGSDPGLQLETPDLPGTSKDNALINCGRTDATGFSQQCTFDDFMQLIQDLFKLVFAFAAFIAVGVFMYAGFLMITAAGNPTQLEQAKAMFRRVVVGFLIMFMAFLVVQQTLRFLQLSPQARQIIGRFIDLGPANTNGNNQ